MRKVFLDNLPKKIWMGRECVDWKNSIGYKVEFIYDDVESWIIIVDYNNNNNKLKIKYKNNICCIHISQFCNGSLGNILNKNTSKFKIEIGTTFKDENRDITIIDRKRIKYKNGIEYKCYKYICNKCGFNCGKKHYNIKEQKYKDELWVTEDNLLKGRGCSCCNNKIISIGINDIGSTKPELVKYFINIEDAYIHTAKSNKKVLCKCPDCGIKKEILISKLYYQGFSCPICGDGISYPNKFMFNLLRQLGVKFISEYNPKWIKKRKYDFYIPSMNLIIEMDGGFHNKYNSLSGQTEKETKEIDNYKDKLANEHGLKVIRIDCDYEDISKRFEYIKNNIIKSRLNKIFNLNNIDWVKIGQLTEKNIVKEVCDYWKLHNNINNENITTTNLTNMFNISISTIRVYLKKGTKLNWCEYNPKYKKSK